MSVIPTVSVAQMREVDRIMVDELHIELLQMMENAGRCLAAHGYSLHGPPSEPIASLIRAANDANAPVVALDVPSGLDADSRAVDPTTRAATTLTLALPKIGLAQLAAREWVGDLHLADISVPAHVYQRFGLEVGPIFAASDIVAVPLDGVAGESVYPAAWRRS